MLVQASAHAERIGSVGRIVDAADIVRLGGRKTGIEAGIGHVLDGERIQAEQLIGLSEQYLDGPSAVELRGRLHADIGAATAFDAVIAREFIDAEQVAGVVYQALGVFVGKLARIGFVGTNDDLRDRLDRRRTPGLNVDEGIAIFEADRRHHAQRLGVADGEEVRNAGLVRDRGIDGVGAHDRKRRPDLADGIGVRAPPLRFSRQPRVGARNAAQQALRGQPGQRIGRCVQA